MRHPPETDLWVTVLVGWVAEAKAVRSEERARDIMIGVQSEWTAQVCEWLDIDHDSLVDKTFAELEKRKWVWTKSAPPRKKIKNLPPGTL